MWNLKQMVRVIALGLAYFPSLAASQPPTHPPDMMDTLNKEAMATDSAGIRTYSEHLALLLPVGLSESTGAAAPTYLSSFSGSLAKAEESARQGKRKLISEETIAEAFNDLMRQTAAPSSFKADVSDVERARQGFKSELPAVISESRNGKRCYPGEAIWVMSMLIENVGANLPPPLHPGPHVSGYWPPVRLHLVDYFSSHSTNDEAAHALDRLAKKLEI